MTRSKTEIPTSPFETKTSSALAMILKLSRLLFALSSHAEIYTKRKLHRDPKRQTRCDVRQMRTRSGIDAESARRAKSGNLLSYDRTVRNDREVIGKIWFSDYRFNESIEQPVRYLLVKYRRDVKSGSVIFVSFWMLRWPFYRR